MMVQVHLEDLAKHFGDTVAVDFINLTIKSGELVVLLGHLVAARQRRLEWSQVSRTSPLVTS